MVIFHGKLLNNQIYYFFFMAHKPSNYQVIPDHICYLGMIMCTFVCLNHKLHCEQQPEWAVDQMVLWLILTKFFHRPSPVES